MHYLGVSEPDLKSLGAIHTAREISQQPKVWLEIWELILSKKEEISQFINSDDYHKVILTGAGTSAYIGESLCGSFQRNVGRCVSAVPTTNLASHPYDYLSKKDPTLLISFARSGNSPESKAAVHLADNICENCKHIIITCNTDGDLASYQFKGNNLIICLPEHTNDKSLAMTSSYSGMLLAGLLISRINEVEMLEDQVKLAAEYGTSVLTDHLQILKEVASLDFKRAVFLGSGPLLGTATESQLKLQELTDGAIICKDESYLGFRHGPKAVVDQETLIVFLLSNSTYVSKYEHDLIFAMNKGKKALAQLAIAERLDFDINTEYKIQLQTNRQTLEEDFLTLPEVLPGQIIGFFKSINEGLSPDEPSKSGAISRVVEGVKIYEL